MAQKSALNKVKHIIINTVKLYCDKYYTSVTLDLALCRHTDTALMNLNIVKTTVYVSNIRLLRIILTNSPKLKYFFWLVLRN